MWQTIKKEDVLREFGTNSKNGLTEEEVKKRQNKYGKNRLKDKPKENIFVKFIKQFNDFMIIILIIASIVSAVISTIQGQNDYIDSIIIIGIVILNASNEYDFYEAAGTGWGPLTFRYAMEIPVTGDNSNWLIAVVVMLLSAIAVVILRFCGQKVFVR